MPSAETRSRSQEPSRRLFFALWPGDADQREMEREARDAVCAVGRAPQSSQRVSKGSAAPRLVPACNFHVTLVFLGSVAEYRVPSVCSVAEAVSADLSADHALPARALELVFDRIEYWKKAKVLCALTHEAAESVARALAAAALADRLREGLLARGFAPDLKPFRAHVTLARKVSPHQAQLHTESAGSANANSTARALTIAPVCWRFTQFALIDSHTRPTGSLYSVLDRWPLCKEGAQISAKKAQ